MLKLQKRNKRDNLGSQSVFFQWHIQVSLQGFTGRKWILQDFDQVGTVSQLPKVSPT